MDTNSDQFHVVADFQPLVRQVGLDAEAVFTDPRIVVWRSIAERENCLLDAQLPDGPVRLHIKRFRPIRQTPSPAEQEVRGIELLGGAGIPTAPLIGWGARPGGWSFIITNDLAGYEPADKPIADGRVDFETVLMPTAELAARLHSANLHHRDLYLCHFLTSPGRQLALIDAAQVRAIPWLFANRWIIKDLAQFWYSTTTLPVSDEQRRRWLDVYAQKRQIPSADRLVRQVQSKSDWIARHDVRLKRKRPERDVSIPQRRPASP